MRKWAAWTGIGFFVVVLSSGWTPWIDALSGAFVPQDIAQDVAAARLFAAGVSPYGPVIREEHARVVPVPVDQTFPYFPHPPFSLLISLYSAFTSFQAAALIWFSASIALVFLLAALVAEHLPGKPVLVCLAFLLCWPPVLYNLEKGQWSILLAVLVTLGWRALARGTESIGAAWIGLAAAVKVFPVVMGGYLLLRSRKSFVAFLIAGVVASAVPLIVIGVEAFPAFLQQARANMPVWETFPSVTLSLHGAVARLFIGGTWARPLVYAPGLARAIDVVVGVGLVGVAAWMTIHAARSRASQVVPFALWTAMLPVMNPQSLGHNGVLLALPLALTLGLALDVASWTPRILWSVALILISVPKQTVWRLAPPPVDPVEGLAVVALPLWGALILFGAAVSLGRETLLKLRPPHT